MSRMMHASSDAAAAVAAGRLRSDPAIAGIQVPWMSWRTRQFSAAVAVASFLSRHKVRHMEPAVNDGIEIAIQ